jgi:serralysin
MLLLELGHPQHVQAQGQGRDRMPTLSNGSELIVWNEPGNPNPTPDSVLFSITETDGDVIGPIGAKPDFPFGGIELASVDVFDGFFTITSFTHEGRTETWTTVETQVFDNEGNFLRTVSDQAAFQSVRIVSISAYSPDDLTVTWIGANEYFGGENTQYGQHQIILKGGAISRRRQVQRDRCRLRSLELYRLGRAGQRHPGAGDEFRR